MESNFNYNSQVQNRVRDSSSSSSSQEQKAFEMGVMKHKSLAPVDVEDQIAIMDNKYTKNLASPFISQQRSWEDDSELQIPRNVQRGIIQELGFIKPSLIQACAIPVISQPDERGNFQNLLAQSKNGSGKTGAFAIGSILRVDSDINAIQVIVVCHVRELCSQIADVYTRLCKYTDIRVSNFTQTGNYENCHILITTLGRLEKNVTARKSMNLSKLKCLVVDEADVFFGDERNNASLKQIIAKQFRNMDVQFILFSATYPDDVKKSISDSIQSATMIQTKKEKLRLDNITQFELQCEPKGKVDIIKSIFHTCATTQTVIFVNTKQFAETLHRLLRKENLKSSIMFGKMEPEERDDIIQKFRRGEINVLITTNMLARGIDVPEVQIVINFDMPNQRIHTGEIVADSESYLHRIGRAGRFGARGIALTLYDRQIDQECLYTTLKEFSMMDSLQKLKNVEHLKDTLQEINNEQF